MTDMTFSLRTTLIGIAYVALWLGAVSTGNTVMIEFMVCVSVWVLFLALPMAIWDSNVERRPFWGGFFAVGIANVLMLFPLPFFGNPIATTQVGQPQFVNVSFPPPYNQFAGSPVFPPQQPVPVAAPNANNFPSFAWLRILIVFVSPFAGGIVVLLAARKRAKKPLQ